MRIGAPISLRSAVRAGAATGHVHVHLPVAVLQGGAVIALIGGVVIGTDKPLGIVLVAGGLLLVALYQYRRHHSPML